MPTGVATKGFVALTDAELESERIDRNSHELVADKKAVRLPRPARRTATAGWQARVTLDI